MIELEPVIRVRELPPSLARLRAHLPSIRDLVSDTPTDLESELLAYLGRGIVCGVYSDPGLLRDAIMPGQRLDVASREDPRLAGVVVQPSLLLTDGRWVWPGELTYYVARYHIQLPQRFFEFARERHWRIEDPIDLGDVSCARWDAVTDVDDLASVSLRTGVRTAQ